MAFGLESWICIKKISAMEIVISFSNFFLGSLTFHMNLDNMIFYLMGI